jgi:hypothetical protein
MKVASRSGLSFWVEPHAEGRDCRWSRGKGFNRSFFYDARMRRFGRGGKTAPAMGGDLSNPREGTHTIASSRPRP